jgi:hypothetical protein
MRIRKDSSSVVFTLEYRGSFAASDKRRKILTDHPDYPGTNLAAVHLSERWCVTRGGYLNVQIRFATRSLSDGLVADVMIGRNGRGPNN